MAMAEWMWARPLSRGGPYTSPLTGDVKKISGSVYLLREPATGSPGCEIVLILQLQLSNCKDACWKPCIPEEKDKDRRLLQEIPRARILYLLYDPSDISWTGEEVDIRSKGESLLKEMVESAHIGQRENCPVVFACQSLGGLVVKKAVIRGCEAYSHDSKYRSFLQNIGGFLFNATPYEGPKAANFVSHFPGMRMAAITAKKLVCRLCGKKLLHSKKGNDIGRRTNERFEHIIGTVKFSKRWRIKNVPATKHTALHRSGGIMGLCMDSVPLSAENFGVSNSKSDKASNGYDVLLELVHAAIRDNDFKLLVSKLLSSTRESLESVRINVSQCTRLVVRIANVIEELEVHESTLEGEDLVNVYEFFLLLLTRSRSLVAECGRSEWVATALIRADNREAFEEIHADLTKFLCKYAVYSRTAGGSTSFNAATLPPMASLLNEDAERDLQDLLLKVKSKSGESARGKRVTSQQRLAVKTWEKIFEVVSDKSKDKGSIREGEVSASYLQIPRSEIVLEKLIGTGSYGDVHKAQWLGCEVCLKEIHWSGGHGEQWLQQAMPLLGLRHPNVLQLVGFSPFSLAGDSTPQPKVLTEIMQGDIRSLMDRLMEEYNGKGTPFKRCVALDIMTQVARGLDHMHTNGFMHGDRVLTTNIIIKVCDDYIDARIGDFGVPLDIPVEYVHVFEPRMGDPEGAETARWIAPEVCARAALYSPASDIYSFGMFCYEVLTGRKPFDRYADMAAIHAQVLTGELRPELPGDLDLRAADIIKKCWHAESSSRPKARAVVDALEAIQFPIIAKH